MYYENETYQINGAAMQVYKTLGHGFLESVYQEALEIEFQKRQIPYEREYAFKVYYDGHELKSSFRVDFLCYGHLIVELKAVDLLTNVHVSQVLNYLKISNNKLGLLINFGHSNNVELKRVIL